MGPKQLQRLPLLVREILVRAVQDDGVSPGSRIRQQHRQLKFDAARLIDFAIERGLAKRLRRDQIVGTPRARIASLAEMIDQGMVADMQRERFVPVQVVEGVLRPRRQFETLRPGVDSDMSHRVADHTVPARQRLAPERWSHRDAGTNRKARSISRPGVLPENEEA